MRTRLSLSPLAAVCTRIADQVSDDSGFVAMHKLLDHFGVELLIRPLLVEGTLATLGSAEGTSNRWAVLLDREKYPVGEVQISGETIDSPLPARMRFTIAHELAHSLAFRPTEFGVRLPYRPGDRQSQGAFVRAVESETDK